MHRDYIISIFGWAETVLSWVPWILKNGGGNFLYFITFTCKLHLKIITLEGAKDGKKTAKVRRIDGLCYDFRIRRRTNLPRNGIKPHVCNELLHSMISGKYLDSWISAMAFPRGFGSLYYIISMVSKHKKNYLGKLHWNQKQKQYQAELRVMNMLFA